MWEKKRKKVLSALKECDLVILVIDPSTSEFYTERLVLEKARESDKQLLVIFNLFNDGDELKTGGIRPVLHQINF